MATKRFRGRTRRMAHRLCWVVLLGAAALLYGAVLVDMVTLGWAALGHWWGRALLAALGLAVVGAWGTRP